MKYAPTTVVTTHPMKIPARNAAILTHALFPAGMTAQYVPYALRWYAAPHTEPYRPRQ